MTNKARCSRGVLEGFFSLFEHDVLSHWAHSRRIAVAPLAERIDIMSIKVAPEGGLTKLGTTPWLMSPADRARLVLRLNENGPENVSALAHLKSTAPSTATIDWPSASSAWSPHYRQILAQLCPRRLVIPQTGLLDFH